MIPPAVKIKLLEHGICCADQARRINRSRSTISLVLSGLRASRPIVSHFAKLLKITPDEMEKIIEKAKEKGKNGQ